MDFDLIVIGGGSGGVRAARVAAELGARVALIEQHELGGTCVNAGCIPKKLLFYGAGVSRALGDATALGAVVNEGLSWPALTARTQQEIARLNQVYRTLLEGAGVKVLKGRALFRDRTTVEVDGQAISSRHVIIATGAQPRPLQIPGRELGLVSDAVFSLAKRPERVIVVGGGYIALELGSMFLELGARVCLVHRGARVLSGFDEDVRAHLTEQLAGTDLELRLGAELRALEQNGGVLRAVLGDGSSVETDAVLFAVGRDANTGGLGLDAAGVRLDSRGCVAVDARNRTSAEGIFAIGDCTGGLALTPVAIAEGQAVAQSLFGNEPGRLVRALVPTAVFCRPEVAKVGLSEQQARAAGHDVVVFRSVFTPLEQRLTGRPGRCLVKLIVERKAQRVLGCHIVAPAASEIIQGFAVALRCGVTKAQLDACLGVHPTIAEELVSMQQPIEV